MPLENIDITTQNRRNIKSSHYRGGKTGGTLVHASDDISQFILKMIRSPCWTALKNSPAF